MLWLTMNFSFSKLKLRLCALAKRKNVLKQNLRKHYQIDRATKNHLTQTKFKKEMRDVQKDSAHSRLGLALTPQIHCLTHAALLHAALKHKPDGHQN